MRRPAFTLIELLMVIAIIGILSTLVVTQLSNTQIKARNAAAQSDVAEMTKAVEAFRTDDTASGMVVSNTPGGIDTLTGTSGTLPQLFTGTQDTTAATYAASVLKTPSSSYTYRYYASGAPTGSSRQLVQAAPNQPEYALCTTLVTAATPYYCSSETAGPQPSSGDLVATATGVVGWWQLEGNGTSTVATDSSGNGNTGTLNNFSFDGTSNGWTSGVYGNGLKFNGTSNYVDAGSGPVNNITTNQLTVSAWVYPTGWPGGLYNEIVSNTRDCGGCGSYNGFSLLAIGTHTPSFSLFNTNISAVNGSKPLSLNQWSFVVGTYDGTTLKLYFNGIVDRQAANTSGLGYPASASLKIGRLGSSATFFWQGSIDDVRIYNRALSASEIQQLYQGKL